jgi:hypothetical protein
MAIIRTGNNLAYGLQNALQTLAPEPIFALRIPTSTDYAQLGTLWVYKATPARIFMFTGSGVWTELASDSGSGIFAALTVNGATALNGALTVNSGTSSIAIGTDSVQKSISIGNATGNTSLVFNAGTGLSKFNTGVATAPVNSSVATAAFVASLTAGTSVQNTTGYDLLCNITLIVSSSTTATITLGVGSATGPTTNTVVPSFTVAAATIINMNAWVPNNYFLVYNTTGTIVVASATVQSCPL